MVWAGCSSFQLGHVLVAPRAPTSPWHWSWSWWSDRGLDGGQHWRGEVLWSLGKPGGRREEGIGWWRWPLSWQFLWIFVLVSEFARDEEVIFLWFFCVFWFWGGVCSAFLWKNVVGWYWRWDKSELIFRLDASILAIPRNSLGCSCKPTYKQHTYNYRKSIVEPREVDAMWQRSKQPRATWLFIKVIEVVDSWTPAVKKAGWFPFTERVPFPKIRIWNSTGFLLTSPFNSWL